MTSISTQNVHQSLNAAMRLIEDAAGADKQVSRADAKALVTDLKDAGNAAAAAAVEQIFAFTDGVDRASGARVTGSDLDSVKGFVERFLIDQNDRNADGQLTQKEMRSMHPMAKALVEYGQVLSLEAKSGRMSKDVPGAGVDHVLNLLTEAAGDDKIASRAEAKDLTASLEKQGRFIEAAAVENFFALADELTNMPGERVKLDDLGATADIMKDWMFADADVNNNGLSKSELSTLSPREKNFVLLGQMLDAGMIG